MKVLVIGGVAAGTKTAAKLKREDRSIQVTLITKSRDISYAGCGLPYYVGGMIETPEELIVNTPEKYAALTGVEVLTGKEAIKLDAGNKSVLVKDVVSGQEETAVYDKLVIATGASPAEIPLKGADLPGVFTMRVPDDAIRVRAYVEENQVKRAVVVGAGFIGLEMAENLQQKGVSVIVIDVAPQILSGILDPEMADYGKKHLLKQGIRVITGTKAEEIIGNGQVSGMKTTAGSVSCELVILAAGIRPNTKFLEGSGIEMNRGTIVVDRTLKTNLPDVYAAGDCVQVANRITGAGQWSPMGSSANLEGRTLAQIAAGSETALEEICGDE